MLDWDFDGIMLADKGDSGSKGFPLGLLNVSTWGCMWIAHCLGMKLNLLTLVRVFLVPPGSWDHQDVVSVPNSLCGKEWGLAGFSLSKSYIPFGSK